MAKIQPYQKVLIYITLEYLIAVQDQIRAYRLAILVSYYIKMQDFGYFWPIFVLN